MNRKIAVAIAAVIVCMIAGGILAFLNFGRHTVSRNSSGMSQNIAQLASGPSRSFASPGCCNGSASN